MNVVAAVLRCWASLWTERAIADRADAGIERAEPAVAVQRMVDDRVAGVLFTADPASGRRTRSVIDAAPGLGDPVVSGAVDPDHRTVDDASTASRPSSACRTRRRGPGRARLSPWTEQRAR